MGEDLHGKLDRNVGGFNILVSSSEILYVGGGFNTEIIKEAVCLQLASPMGQTQL